MPNRYPLPNNCGMGFTGHMDTAIILNVGARSDTDKMNVPPDGDMKPDAGLFANIHIPNHHRRGGDKRAGGNAGVLMTIGVQIVHGVTLARIWTLAKAHAIASL